MTKRLLIVGEGTTEVDFVLKVLKPRLDEVSNHQLEVRSPNLKGYKTYHELVRFITKALNDSNAIVTTMLDLFRLPSGFPGRDDAAADCNARVKNITSLFARDLSNDRFQPYLQLHEFEALVLCGLMPLADRYPDCRKSIESLAKQVGTFDSPEHINKTTPPSYRIQQAVPEYSKRLDGMICVQHAGLPTLRERCPHFGAWLTWMEKLAAHCREHQQC